MTIAVCYTCAKGLPGWGGKRIMVYHPGRVGIWTICQVCDTKVYIWFDIDYDWIEVQRWKSVMMARG